MNRPVEVSYAWCADVARRRAKNFYPSFLLLDARRRRSMCAVYAFMRVCDDLSDEPGEKTMEVFEDWRVQMQSALQGGGLDSHPVWPALHDTVTRYKIPHEYLHQMIDGVAYDIAFRRMNTFEELYAYCYRVASVVGLTVVHILGFRSPDALPLAEKCGVAFQLTNILRDVSEDFGNGRLYLPAEDLTRFSVAESDLAGQRVSEPLRNLLQFEAARAKQYYRDAMPLLDLVEPSGRAMLRAIIEIYSRLLLLIESENYEVLGRRLSVSKPRKLWILAKSYLKSS
ncbi:MAG: phytoene/squalene synthase family protein [Candidatus Solibacter usitatus]|nr:phytoene/squalene synthase family protein [Candidatus Solibacter usitatus]